MTAQEEIIRIKDKRKGVFTVDNVVLNGYGKALGATGIAFYVTLCRYANRETQQAFPSITTIQNETGMHRMTIISAAQKCEELGLIKKQVKTGAWTTYLLLEPKRHHPCQKYTSSATSVKNDDTRVKNDATGSILQENECILTNEDNGKLKLIRKELEAKGILKRLSVIKSYPHEKSKEAYE